MAIMGAYCKAYPASRLRAFPAWQEKVAPLKAIRDTEGIEESKSACEEEIEYFYLQEDCVVTAGIFRDENIAFDEITADWKRFCCDELKFAVPSYLSEAPAGRAEAGQLATDEAVTSNGSNNAVV